MSYLIDSLIMLRETSMKIEPKVVGQGKVKLPCSSNAVRGAAEDPG